MMGRSSFSPKKLASVGDYLILKQAHLTFQPPSPKVLCHMANQRQPHKATVCTNKPRNRAALIQPRAPKKPVRDPTCQSAENQDENSACDHVHENSDDEPEFHQCV